MTNHSQFVIKANKKFNFKFDYSKFEYTNAKTLSVIVCPEHGEFTQSPTRHLSNMYACHKCERAYKKKKDQTGIPNLENRMSSDEFLRRFTEKFGTKYTALLTNYSGRCGNDIEIVCQDHGVQTISPFQILKLVTPCKVCSNETRSASKTKSYNVVVEQLKIKHNNQYVYPTENELEYVNKRSKIKIICPEHGEYVKTSQKHLSGQGCFQCKMAESIKAGNFLGGYSDIFFENNPEKKTEIGILYYVKVGNLYKIGITTKLDKRIRSIKSESKKSVDIILSKEYNLIDAYNIEQTILRENMNDRIFRKWSTELFEIDITKNILKHFGVEE